MASGKCAGMEPRDRPGTREFATTHWSVVIAAGGGEGERTSQARERLCSEYWLPLYAYVRRRGYSPADAEDLTQEFLSRLVASGDLGNADPRRGRFRVWLLGCLRHLLANDWDRRQARKRGGGCTFVTFSGIAGAEDRYHSEFQGQPSAERAFERSWALALIEGARRDLRLEYERRGWQERFELFERFLPGEGSALTQAEVGRRLGLSEGAVKAEVHRLKRRLGDLLRNRIAQTVEDPAEIDDELRALKLALSG